jgi:hypothetical protein
MTKRKVTPPALVIAAQIKHLMNFLHSLSLCLCISLSSLFLLEIMSCRYQELISSFKYISGPNPSKT